MEKYSEAHAKWQREYVTRALLECDGSVIKASKITGINRTHFYKLCRKLGMVLAKAVPGRKATTVNKGNSAWQQLGRESHG